MAKQRPVGLTLLALCAALFAALMALLLLDADGYARRGALALLGALSLTAADALWHARPWAFRASAALATAFAATVLAAGATSGDLAGAGAWLLLIVVFLLPTLGYVASVMATLHPPAAPPTRVPSPGWVP
jgi:hypothetical protein